MWLRKLLPKLHPLVLFTLFISFLQLLKNSNAKEVANIMRSLSLEGFPTGTILLSESGDLLMMKLKMINLLELMVSRRLKSNAEQLGNKSFFLQNNQRLEYKIHTLSTSI